MKFFVIFVMGSVLLAQPSTAHAQQTMGQSATKSGSAENQWGAIAAVPAGTDMIIETKTGKTIKGKFVDVTGSTLRLSRKNTDVPIELPQVQKVYRVVGRSRKESSAIGAAAGGLAGLGVGLGVYLPARDDIVGAIVPGFAVIGAGIGAVIGVATGKGRKRILIYEAK